MHLKLSSHMAKSWGKTDLFSSSQITWHQRVAGMNAWLARTSPATYPAIVRHSGLSLSHTETGETGEMLLQTVKLKATYSYWQQEQLYPRQFRPSWHDTWQSVSPHLLQHPSHPALMGGLPCPHPPIWFTRVFIPASICPPISRAGGSAICNVWRLNSPDNHHLNLLGTEKY